MLSPKVGMQTGAPGSLAGSDKQRKRKGVSGNPAMNQNSIKQALEGRFKIEHLCLKHRQAGSGMGTRCSGWGAAWEETLGWHKEFDASQESDKRSGVCFLAQE